MAAYVYLLGTLNVVPAISYVGWTFDLERRLAEHNGHSKRGAKATRGRQWALLYAEKLDDKSAAMSREWHLKRNRKLRSLILKSSQG